MIYSIFGKGTVLMNGYIGMSWAAGQIISIFDNEIASYWWGLLHLSLYTKNLECTRKKMWYGPQSKEMEAKPYFDARILVIHMKITIL